MEKKTKRTWSCIIKEANNFNLVLNVSHSKNLVFDIIYLLIYDSAGALFTNVFAKTLQSGFTIPIADVLRQSEYKIQLYGLRNITVGRHQYDNVVCYGESEFKVAAVEKRKDLIVVLDAERDAKLPGELNSQGTLPTLIHRHLPDKYAIETECVYIEPVVFLVFIKHGNTISIFNSYKRHLEYEIPIDLPSAIVVKCRVLATCRKSIEERKYFTSRTTAHSKIIDFKTLFTKVDVDMLYQLALSFGTRNGNSGLRPIRYFYRNKTEEYFMIIRLHTNGEMRPYLKNHGAEQGSVLNGRVKGLFFSTLVDKTTNRPQPFSHYGPVRLYVEAQLMCNPKCNLYFSDFYCHNVKHHLTVVLMPKSSPCNELCRQYLLQLDIYNNPYLRVFRFPNGSSCVLANMDIIVEIFYTEIVNVSHILESGRGYMVRTPTIGRGFAPSSGIPKKSTCKICNINRISPSEKNERQNI
ncbi:uncharacterized protein LOC127725721 isoform X2 [Mytilus californianus]|uniref:uncharacterized protein LOC127725721 isoform X2 n=1 Tax=Mytilus californianus TaxID=6549 RepID=UPI002248552D|nr:uncharacterized protein LOC127725721 isoform X2 [Mytilus californianus]